MDFVTLLLLGTITFNLVLVIGAMYLVRRSWKVRNADQRRRQARMVEQGKIITLQEELIAEKNKLIDAYRESQY